MMKLIFHTSFKVRKAFANGSSTKIKFSKSQLSKMLQSAAVIRDIPVFGNILSSVAKKGTDMAASVGKNFLDKQID